MNTPKISGRALLLRFTTTLLLAPLIVQAAIFQVDRFDDTFPGDLCDGAIADDCSLRNAVTVANQTPGPDIIELEAGVYVLTRTGIDDLNLNGDLDITDSVLIRGAGMDLTTIDAGGDGALEDRLVQVLGGGVEVEDLTLTGGRLMTVSESGGALRAVSPITLRRVRVSDNVSTEAGGAISAETELVIVDSELNANVAVFGSGGAALCRNGSMRIENSLLTSNVALDGGAVFADDCMVEISGSVIDDNHSDATGGGLFLKSSSILNDLIMTSTTISNNQAIQAGGVHADLTANLDQVWITGNHASDAIGGVHFGPNGSGFMQNSTINANTAPTAAAVDIDGGPGRAFVNVTITGNSGTFRPFMVVDGTVSFFHVTFVNNPDMSSQGALSLDASDLTLRNSLLQGGCSVTNGGSISSLGGNLEQVTDTCGMSPPMDQVMVPGLLLDGLANTGGYAPTLRPDVDSPAIDAGVNTHCEMIETDQRGLPRRVALNGPTAICDAGAVEFQESESGRIFKDGFEI